MRFLLQGFVIILTVQICIFSFFVMLTVSEERMLEEMNQHLYWGEIGLGAFIAACILLRVLVSMNQPTLLAAMIGVYTLALSMMGCQVVAWLLSSDPQEYDSRDDVFDDASVKRGKNSVYFGCISIVLSFVVVQCMKKKEDAIQTLVVQSVLIIMLFNGLLIICMDDRVWDWRYAYIMLFAIAAATYLNCISTYYIDPRQDELPFMDSSNSPSSKSPFYLVALVILQPILFTESWLTMCLLG